jgi:Glycosyltransferase family 87
VVGARRGADGPGTLRALSALRQQAPRPWGAKAVVIVTAALALSAVAPDLAGAAGGAPGSTTGAARGREPTDPNQLVTPASQVRPPPGRVHSAREILRIAARDPRVIATLRRHPGATGSAYFKGQRRWQVSYFTAPRPGQPPSARKEIAQVLIDDRSGAVLESWSGFQVAWTMARGYPGAFGRKASALYVWLPLLVLFVVPFVDRRRLRSMRHLDLLVLASFSVSLAFFSHGYIGVSVPLAYPPLAYLLVRMLLVARARGREPGGEAPAGPALLVPASWLAVGLVFLIGFRIGLNVVDSNVIDVGYAGVIGANRIVQGKPIYHHFPRDNERGDTYGPVVYYAYVPFERLWPWSGRWDDLPAAHGAAVGFDLLAILLVFLAGVRIRGPTLGIALAYAWAAYPFTLLVSSSNSNDSLVTALVMAALLLAGRPAARGAAVALAAATKFAPLALAPLFALYRPGGGGRRAGSVRSLALFSAGFLVAAGLAFAPVLLPGEGGEFWRRAVVNQAERESPFSLWGLVGGLRGVQTGVQLAVAALAVTVAFVPRRRDVVTLATLAAAVLIAVQIGVTHWFYLYIVWFFPLVMVAVLAGSGPAGPPPAPGRPADRAREPAVAA